MGYYHYEPIESEPKFMAQRLVEDRIPVRATITIPQKSFTWSDNLTPEVEDFIYDTAQNEIMRKRISFEEFKSGPMRIRQVDSNTIKASGTFIVAYEADFANNVRNIQTRINMSNFLTEVIDIYKFKYKNPNFSEKELKNTKVEIELEIG